MLYEIDSAFIQLLNLIQTLIIFWLELRDQKSIVVFDSLVVLVFSNFFLQLQLNLLSVKIFNFLYRNFLFFKTIDRTF